MVTIRNDGAYALMSLSKRFAKTADNVVEASTLGLGAQKGVEGMVEEEPTVPPAIQPRSPPSTLPGKEVGIDLIQEMVHLNTAETYYAANLKVVAAEDDLLGTVLDILA